MIIIRNIVIVIFSGFGEFEYAKKAIQYGVSEYLLKAGDSDGTYRGNRKNEEKSGTAASLKKVKWIALTEDFGESIVKMKQIIRSKNIEALVNCTTDVNADVLNVLQKWGLTSPAAELSRGNHLILTSIPACTSWIQKNSQESALMAFVLFNISDEIVTRRRGRYCLSGRQ